MQGLKGLPADSVDCCVTSPPYFGLRDYGIDGQIGLDKMPEDYIARLVCVFNEVYRVLKPEGTLWLNVGDSYAGSNKGWADSRKGHGMQPAASYASTHKAYKGGDCKPKDLIGIPWMLAFALRGEGWYLRQDIIWHKPNAMPESVTDRCAKSHEYIFLLTKSRCYYFDADAIKQPAKCRENRPAGVVRNREYGYRSKSNLNPAAYMVSETPIFCERPLFADKIEPQMVNKRSVWSVATKPSKVNHFAAFPDTLIIDCIKAGCPAGGVVLDPFMGSGTTAVAARDLGRNYVGFELNSDYIAICNDRLKK